MGVGQWRRRATAIAAASLAVAALVIVCAFADHIMRRPLGPPAEDSWLKLAPVPGYIWAGAADRDHLYAAFNHCPTVPTPEPTVWSTLSPVPDRGVEGAELPTTTGPVHFPTTPVAASAAPTFPSVFSQWPDLGPTATPTPTPICELTLLASTDGGINWEARPAPFPDWYLQFWLFGTETLYARTPQGIDVVIPFHERISFDGGRTWGPVVQNDEPLDAMPAGAVPLCLPNYRGCPLTAADPVTRTIRPLRNQPRVAGPNFEPIRPNGGLWVTWWDEGRHRRLLTSSRDGGRTWSSHVVSPDACTDGGGSFSLDTADGRTLYARTYAPATVCRSTDGGVTWQSIPATPDFGFLDVAFVAPDNTHVLGWLIVDATGPDYVRYLASHDGGSYVEIDSAPMSAQALTNVKAAVAGGGYVTWDEHGVFRSDDSLTWYRVLPPG